VLFSSIYNLFALLGRIAPFTHSLKLISKLTVTVAYIWYGTNVQLSHYYTLKQRMTSLMYEILNNNFIYTSWQHFSEYIWKCQIYDLNLVVSIDLNDTSWCPASPPKNKPEFCKVKRLGVGGVRIISKVVNDMSDKDFWRGDQTGRLSVFRE